MAFHDNSPNFQFDRRNPISFTDFGGGNNSGIDGLSINRPIDYNGINTEGGATPDMFSKLFGKDGPVVPGLNALGGLGSAYAAFQTAKTGRKAFNFSRDLAKTNLANSAQIANTEIGDRARASGRQSGLTGQQLENFVNTRIKENRVSGVV